jgi:ligand-binding sensor domain-containing protein/serine phosphatase RsbU (regulator of sigma subunit)
MRLRLFLPLLAAAWLPGLASGSAATLDFERISLAQGLSQSIIEGAIQDRVGFLWFATEDGLNRYDGYRFAVLRNDADDPNSLSYNDLKCVVETRDGALWIGTFEGGLNRYDPRTGRFTRFRHDPGNPSSLAADSVRAILEDREGNLWIGTQGGGLDRLDRSSGRFEHHRPDPADPTALADGDIRVLHEDRAGTLWIGTAGGGLARWDPGRKIFVRYSANPSDPTALPHPWVQAIAEDRDGAFWIGTFGGGLVRFDRGTGRATRYPVDPRSPGALPDGKVTALVEDHEGALWVGTDGGGLARLDRERRRFDVFRNDPTNPHSLSTDRLFSLLEDRSRVLWIGTYGGGLDKLDLGTKKFVTVRRDPNDPRSLSHDIVWSVVEDPEGRIWVGTDSGGLNRIDRKTGEIRHYRHDPRDPTSLASDTVRYLYLDSLGNFWVATHGGGLDRFDPATGRFEHHRHDPADPGSIALDELRTVYEDRRGNLWVGTYGGGLDRLDRKSGRFFHLRHDPADPKSLPSDYLRVVFEDSRGELWVGTQGGGLAKFDRDRGTFTTYRTDPRDRTTIGSDFVFAVHESRRGDIWVATYGGGIALLDRKSGRFRRYTTRDGLPSNSVYGILEDDAGRLWMSTNAGLCRFEPATGSFHTFGARDGLQSDEFNGGSFFESRRGEMFFGGIHGFNSFFPSEIVLNAEPPPVVITDLQLFNRSVRPGEAISGPPLLARPIEYTDSIELAWGQDVVTFEFAALSFASPERNQYRYRLEGFSDEWIDARAGRRSATFTRLDPGNYVFAVQAANPDGAWNEKGVRLAVRVLPPFWATWWFRLLAIVAVLGSANLLWRRRTRAIRLRTELRSAQHAQMAIMPRADPLLPGFEISGLCIPAHEVGGDFFDYVWLDDEASASLCIGVGDVSGKGMASAMAAALSSGMVHAQLRTGTPLAESMTRLNRSVHRKVERPMFTALLLARLDPGRRRLELVNAGVCPPLLKRGDEVVELESTGPSLPLGGFPATAYESVTFDLQGGDLLLFVTDGVPEATDREGKQLGYDATRKLLGSIPTGGLDARGIARAVVDEVGRFARGSSRHDDTTVVVVRVI